MEKYYIFFLNHITLKLTRYLLEFMQEPLQLMNLLVFFFFFNLTKAKKYTSVNGLSFPQGSKLYYFTSNLHRAVFLSGFEYFNTHAQIQVGYKVSYNMDKVKSIK